MVMVGSDGSGSSPRQYNSMRPSRQRMEWPRPWHWGAHPDGANGRVATVQTDGAPPVRAAPRVRSVAA